MMLDESMLQMLRAAGFKCCRVLRDGSLTGAGVESVLSLVTDCVFLSLDRAVGTSKGQEGVREAEGGQERSGATKTGERARERLKDGGGTARRQRAMGELDGAPAPTKGRDRLVSACPQATNDPLANVRHCVLRGAKEGLLLPLRRRGVL